jgi:DNA adenine methylase
MKESSLRRQPISPAAAYVGGKRQLARTIVAQIEKLPHEIYAEPFVGMGGVFLRRPFAARSEVINDFNRDVATFFRILQRHYAAFLGMMNFQLTTRAEFERLKATAPETLTDLERAARFLYLQRTAFGGKVSGRNFGVDPGVGAPFNVTKLAPLLDELHERLAGVTIECLPYDGFIRRYDRPGTLFYLDPPYWGSEDYYGKGMFSKADFERLAEILAGIKGRFLLSINDVPPVRRIFGAFKLRPVRLHYGLSGGQRPAKELLIMGAR